MIKRQQFTETRIANNQACDEIHDLQPKYSSNKKFVENKSLFLGNGFVLFIQRANSQELMQGDYYARTRLDPDASPHEQIDINLEDYRDRIKVV